MVLLALPPADHLLIERDRGQFVPSRRRGMANVLSLIASATLRQVLHGEPGATGLSRMPMARNPARDGNAVGPVPIADQVAWALFQGNASVVCCATHSAVGCARKAACSSATRLH